MTLPQKLETLLTQAVTSPNSTYVFVASRSPFGGIQYSIGIPEAQRCLSVYFDCLPMAGGAQILSGFEVGPLSETQYFKQVEALQSGEGKVSIQVREKELDALLQNSYIGSVRIGDALYVKLRLAELKIRDAYQRLSQRKKEGLGTKDIEDIRVLIGKFYRRLQCEDRFKEAKIELCFKNRNTHPNSITLTVWD